MPYKIVIEINEHDLTEQIKFYSLNSKDDLPGLDRLVKETDFSKTKLGETLISFINMNIDTIKTSIIDLSKNNINFVQIDAIIENLQSKSFIFNYLYSYVRKINEGQNYADIITDLVKFLNKSMEIIKQFRELMIFCFAENENNEICSLDPIKKFYIYSNYFDKSFKHGKLSILYTPVIHNFNNSILTNNLTKADLKDIYSIISDKQVHFILSIEPTEDIFEVCYALFIQLINKNIKIKQCAYCHNYFILWDGYNSVYCNNIPVGETKTCQQIGATRKYINKVKNDPLYNAYNKAYQTHFGRKRNGKIDDKEFQSWTHEAKEMRDKALNKLISIEEFKRWLKQN